MRGTWLGLLVLLAAGSGCLGRGYARVMEIHVEVLSSMASKMCDMARDGKPPRAEMIPEFVYPAQRARQFTRYFSRNSSRRSYQIFGEMVDRYEAEVKLVDKARGEESTWQQQAAAICEAQQTVQASAQQLRAVLRAEG